jgi:hypothetical protein
LFAIIGHGGEAPIDQCTPAPLPYCEEFPVGVQFKMSIKATEQNATIQIEHHPGDETGVRYLTRQPDYCVYTRKDAATGIVFTGPLSGCNIYVAGPRTDPVLFHTNSNPPAGIMQRLPTLPNVRQL